MYTHTFEVRIGDIVIEGEISFNGEGKPMYKLTDGNDEMQIGQHQQMAMLFEQIYILCKKCGEITKIEIKKK